MTDGTLATTLTEHQVLVAADRTEHATLGAELLAGAIVDAIAERGVARVALSGGSTPSEAYQRLSALPLPFDRIHWFWVDERGVPPGSPRSNFGVASADLSLEDGGHGHAHRMEGERDLTEAAAAYEAELRKAFGVAAAVSFDAMTLGVGDDGHTASLFPGIGAVKIGDRLVAHIPEQPAKKLEARITLTAPVIVQSKLLLVLARGEAKKPWIAAARAPGSADEVPARIIQRARGRVVWLLDREAAG